MPVKKKLFDSMASHNVGAIIAHGSALYIVRETMGDTGMVYYASPILRPEKAINMKGCMVVTIRKAQIQEAHTVILKSNGCFYT